MAAAQNVKTKTGSKSSAPQEPAWKEALRARGKSVAAKGAKAINDPTPKKSQTPKNAPTDKAQSPDDARAEARRLASPQPAPTEEVKHVVGVGKSAGLPAPTISALKQILDHCEIEPNEEAFTLLVTPELAEKFLKLNVSNRFLAVPQCKRHAQAMLDGNWKNDGNPLKFNTNGKFMDGQHRLTGLIMANKAIEFDIRLNLPPETQATMDTGRRRSVADQLQINQEPYAKVLAGTIGWIFRLCFNDMSYRIETPETLDFIDKNPKIRESVAFVAGGSKTVKGTVSTLLAAVHYIATTVLNEGDKANQFVEVFRSGYPAYQGDPAHRLREDNMRIVTLQQMRTDKASADVLIYAWNLFREQKTSRSLMPKGPQQIDGFKPEMIGISVDRDYDVEKMVLPMGQTVERRVAE